MTKIILQNVRGSYVYVISPKKNVDKKTGITSEKYTMQVIIPKSDKKQIAKIRKVCEEVAREKFGSKIKLSMLKMPLRDGDKDRDSEDYVGMAFLNANSARKPGIVNKAGEPADQDDLEELCYSGAYFHVSCNFYAFDREDGKGVAVGLNNVMLRKAGPRLDGSTSASDDFSDYADGYTDEDEDDDGWGDTDDEDDEIPF